MKIIFGKQISLLTFAALLTAASSCATRVSTSKSLADIVVAADGSGQFTNVQAAIDAAPTNSARSFVILIKTGTYPGQIIVPKEKPYLKFVGEETETTTLTYWLNQNEPSPGGGRALYNNASVVVLADDFRAEKITFQNTSGDREVFNASYKNNGFLHSYTQWPIASWPQDLPSGTTYDWDGFEQDWVTSGSQPPNLLPWEHCKIFYMWPLWPNLFSSQWVTRTADTKLIFATGGTDITEINDWRFHVTAQGKKLTGYKTFENYDIDPSQISVGNSTVASDGYFTNNALNDYVIYPMTPTVKDNDYYIFDISPEKICNCTCSS